MRLLKLVLGVGIVAGLFGMWSERALVVDAYSVSSEDPTTDIRLGGLDLTVTLSPLEPTPYRIDPAPDTRGVPVALAFRNGETANDANLIAPVSMRGGASGLSGVVTGPEGPVEAAIVRIERHTTEGLASEEVTTDSLGRWSLQRVLGGRYRVRAWLAGRYTMTESHVFFLPDDQDKALDLVVDGVDSKIQMSFAAGGDIYLGLTGTVAVSVTTRSIDAQGFTVVSGVPGAIVTLAPTAEATAQPSVVVADTDGVARFVVRCEQLGTATAVAKHQEQVASFTLPSCVPAPPPELLDDPAPPPELLDDPAADPVADPGDGEGSDG